MNLSDTFNRGFERYVTGYLCGAKISIQDLDKLFSNSDMISALFNNGVVIVTLQKNKHSLSLSVEQVDDIYCRVKFASISEKTVSRNMIIAHESNPSIGKLLELLGEFNSLTNSDTFDLNILGGKTTQLTLVSNP